MTDPTGLTATAGSQVTFTATASGNPAATVQWEVSSDGVRYRSIPGATSATNTFTATPADDGKLYRAVFSNALGSAATAPATLTVEYAPTITTGPSNQTVNAGTTVTFAASASGNPTPAVQWQIRNDGGTTYNDIDGAGDLIYSFTATAADNGSLFR